MRSQIVPKTGYDPMDGGGRAAPGAKAEDILQSSRYRYYQRNLLIRLAIFRISGPPGEICGLAGEGFLFRAC